MRDDLADHLAEILGLDVGQVNEGGEVPCVAAPWLALQCAVKGAGLQRVQLPPGNWFAPPGNNRSDGGGNEAGGAFGVEGR